MNEFYVRNVLEAALLAAGKPLQLVELSQLFDETARPKTDDIRAALDALASDYANRGIEVKETAAGFRIQVRREFSAEISRLWPERPVRYSRALLETLALIAYRQPITRAEIEAVRGVAVNPNIIKTVIERNWVRVVGHRDVPGRPELLGTTREFLDYFGLRSLDELPALAEIKALGNPQLELPGSGTAALEGPSGEGESEGLSGGAAAAELGVPSVALAGLLTNDGATSDAASPDVSDAPPDAEAVDGAHTTDAVAEHTGDAPVASEGVAVASDAALGEGESTSAASPPPAHAVSHGAHMESDAEVERTLSGNESSGQHATAEAEDAETNSSDSPEAGDESSDEETDEDELSADGHGSRELVAGPRDLED
jgi:segregation and condensation protein B